MFIGLFIHRHWQKDGDDSSIIFVLCWHDCWTMAGEEILLFIYQHRRRYILFCFCIAGGRRGQWHIFCIMCRHDRISYDMSWVFFCVIWCVDFCSSAMGWWTADRLLPVWICDVLVSFLCYIDINRWVVSDHLADIFDCCDFHDLLILYFIRYWWWT